MSNNILKSALVMFIGALVGYGSMSYWQSQTKNRGLASAAINKIGKYQNAHYYFDVKIDTDSIARQEEQVSVLKVSVTALKDFNEGLTATWNLPQETEIISGNIHESLGAFKKDERKEFILKVKGFSKTVRRYMSFEIQGFLDQRNVHREMLISSRVEDSFEYVVQQNEKQKNSGLLQKLGTKKEKNKFSADKVIR